MAISLPAFLNPLLALLGMGLGIGALLGFIAGRFRVQSDPVVDKINDILPQTQCGQCGYPGCKPYAEAIAAGAAINKCPPGGDATIARLAGLLNVRALPLDEHHGTAEPRRVAFIREAECIGCAKCIPACPVDAILGAPKFMHTVIESECTGCDLCVEPCPVDCIDMVPVKEAVTNMYPGSVPAAHLPCINCGLCAPACPVAIQPHELYRACRNKDLELAQELKLTHCIECGKCDAVCPSHIPLTRFFQTAKLEWHREKDAAQRATRAKHRFALHQQRMADLANNRNRISAESIQATLERVKAKQQS